ncbi:MAG: hypothetical protein ACEPO2_00270 [Pelagibaca sp.]
MPATYQILPSHNLVYVRYSGAMMVADSLKAFGAYASDPAARPGQRHLIDLSRITDMERDFARIMQLQATKGAELAMRETETLMIYFANTPLSLRSAALAKNGWSASQGVIAVVLEREDAVMTALGLPFQTIDEMLAIDMRKVD